MSGSPLRWIVQPPPLQYPGCWHPLSSVLHATSSVPYTWVWQSFGLLLPEDDLLVLCEEGKEGRSGFLSEGNGMGIWGAMTPWTDCLLNPLLLSLLPHLSPVVPNAFSFSGVLWVPVLQELVWLSLPFLPSFCHFSVFKNSSSRLHISLLVSSKVNLNFCFLFTLLFWGTEKGERCENGFPSPSWNWK